MTTRKTKAVAKTRARLTNKNHDILVKAVRASAKDRKTKRELTLTPIGTARFAYLSAPDEYEGKKRYRTQLLLTPGDAEPLKEMLTKLVDEAHAANIEKQESPKAKKAAQAYRKRYPFEDDVDAEGNETGLVVFKFAQNATITLKDGTEKHVRPLLIDAARRPVDPETVKVFTGSKIRVAFTARPYANAAAEAVGLSLDLHKVQIIELAKRNSNYEDDTFGAVEGGFTQDALENQDDTADEGAHF